MVIRKGNHKTCAALSIFLLTMSRLVQEQYNITITILVNGALFNAVAQYFNVHRNSVSQLLCKTDIFTHFTLRNRFRNAALASRNILGMTSITGQAVRNRLREINLVPTGLQ